MSNQTKKVIASESAHWYTKTGEPCYEVENKSNGGMRPTTLRDAKKLDLVPSVTSILQILSRPGLEAWKQNQILLSAATSPYLASWIGADKWAELVLADAQEQAEKARQLGTDIHTAIEKSLQSGSTSGDYEAYIKPVIFEMLDRNLLVGMKTEHSFAHPIGFGGKIDFHNDTVLIDFKTKEFTKEDLAGKKKLAWDEMCWQLAAYRFGIQEPRLHCFNVFISTSEPGLFSFHEWSAEELSKGLSIFLKTLELWKIIKIS